MHMTEVTKVKGSCGKQAYIWCANQEGRKLRWQSLYELIPYNGGEPSYGFETEAVMSAIHVARGYTGRQIRVVQRLLCGHSTDF